MIADLAYRRMIDLYYITEKPLDLDISIIAKKIGMKGKEKIISEIISDFFMKSEDGYRSSKCDSVISDYNKKAARAKDANGKRWGKVPSETPLKSDVKSDPSQNQNQNQKPITIIPLSPQGGIDEANGKADQEEVARDQADFHERDRKEFDEFWNAYPEHRRTKMVSLQREWVARQFQRPPFSELMAALKNHKDSEDWQKEDGKFIPSALNWISEQMWHEKKPKAKKTNARPSLASARPIPEVDEDAAFEWRKENYPLSIENSGGKAGYPFRAWPEKIRNEFLDQK